MSTQQIQRCVCEILGLNLEDGNYNWGEGRLKKMVSTTSTLYNVSLSKVMLKQNEEVARCHICAYIAADKLSEKYEPDLKYYRDKIPLEPRKTTKIIGIFKQNIFMSSPVKNLSWSPSPRKKLSSVKNGARFTAMDPSELRKQLFGTPTKSRGEAQALQRMAQLPSTKATGISSGDARRKLRFEENDSDEEDYGALSGETPVKGLGKSSKPSRKLLEAHAERGGNVALNAKDEDGVSQEEAESSTEFNTPLPSPRKRGRPPNNSATPSPKKLHAQESVSPRKKRGEYGQNTLLRKKYYKVSPKEIIILCNHFEIPRDTAYKILDQFSIHASYLVFPFQLVCGLIMNCCLVIFNEKRLKDSRIDEYLFKKMAALMHTSDMEDIIESIKIVKELVVGERWFRTLKVDYNYYDGAEYEETIATRLGNMLQKTNILATEDQFERWKHKVLTDISLRDG